MNIKIKPAKVKIKTNVQKIYPEIETEELNITPSIETQVKEGLYDKVTVIGDDNLKPENIKKGVTIFGVEGTYAGSEIIDDTKEYIELEYIEATGTQYINTGYTPNHDTSIDMNVSNVTHADAPMISSSSKWQLGSFILTCGQGIYRWYYNGETNIGNVTGNIDNIFLYRRYTKLNNVVVSSDTNVNSGLVSDAPLRIFNGVVGGSMGAYTSYRLHSFKISESGISDNPTYIRNFVPAKLKSTGEIGLYDKVEEKFYSNEGSGTFLAGSEIDEGETSTPDETSEYGTLVLNGGEIVEGEVLKV